MQMQCKRCKTFFKYDKYDGICPQCAYFNRPPGMEEVDLFEDDKRFQTENYVLPQMEGIHMELHKKYDSDKARKDGSDRGVLYAAGMIAGEGIVGILLAVLAVFNVADKIDLSSVYGGAFETTGNWVGLVAFIVLLATLFYFTRNKKTIEVDAK